MNNLNSQQDNFQADLENLLKDLEEIDADEFTREMNHRKFLNMKRDEEKKRAVEQQKAQEASASAAQQKQKLQQMLEKKDREQQFNHQHAAQMSIDTKTVSELLKELDLVDYRPYPQESAQFTQKDNGAVSSSSLRQLNPQHYNNNSSITSKILFASNFEKDDSIIRIDTSFNNNAGNSSGSNSSGNIQNNNNNNNNKNNQSNTNPMSMHSRNGQNTQNKANSNMNKLEYEESFDQQAQQEKLFKEFQLHEMQHQLLQDHFLNNNSIIQQNSIINNNNSLLINNTFLPSSSIQPSNNNNNNNLNNVLHTVNNNNNTINPNVNQTAGFDDIDNFLRQLDENETVLYSSSNDMLH